MVWFKHDTHASIDSKLQELMLDYGAAGYGLYWYCVELIAQTVDKDNITFELEHDARIIARNLNLTVTETMNMMKKMVDLNLFSLNDNNKLACYALAKRLDQSMTSNKDFRLLIDKIKHSHDTVMTNHDLVMNRREEKRREENINGKPFSFNLTRLTSVDNLSKEYLSNLKDYIEAEKKSLSYDDFIIGLEASGKKYKNYKSAYITWAKNHDKWNNNSTTSQTTIRRLG